MTEVKVDHDPHYIRQSEYRALEGSGELQELSWVDIEAAQHLELPHITRLVLGEAQRRLREGHGPEESGPFAYFRQGKPIVEQH
jgi:hypothetical protein